MGTGFEKLYIVNQDRSRNQVRPGSNMAADNPGLRLLDISNANSPQNPEPVTHAKIRWVQCIGNCLNDWISLRWNGSPRQWSQLKRLNNRLKRKVCRQQRIKSDIAKLQKEILKTKQQIVLHHTRPQSPKQPLTN
jgi:hypothetical protein